MNLLWSNFAIGQIFIEIYGNFCFCGLNNLVTLHRKKIPFKTLLKHLFPFCVVKKYFTCTKQEIGKQNQNIQKYFSSSPANMFQWERKKEREKELNTSVYYLYTSCILVVHELYTSVIRRYKIPSPYFISLRRGVQPTTTTTTSPSSLSIQLGDCLEQNKDVIFELFWCSTHTYTPAVRRPLFKLKLRQWKMVLIGKKLEEQIF